MSITRQTKVVAISVSPDLYRILEKLRKQKALSRSGLIQSLLLREYEQEKTWQNIFVNCVTLNVVKSVIGIDIYQDLNISSIREEMSRK